MNESSIRDHFGDCQMKSLTPTSRLILYFLAGFTVLYFVMSSYISIPFAHHDQYRYFTGLPGDHYKESCTDDVQYTLLQYVARLATAEVECIVFKNVVLVGDLTKWRVAV